MTAETIHTCSYACERPECIRAQRDELASRLTAPPPAAAEQKPVGEVNARAGVKWYSRSVPATGTLLYTAPPAAARGDVRGLVEALVHEIERNTCLHEETYRGGAIWEICRQCDAQWADDKGGRPEFKWPECVESAREWLAAEGVQAGEVERALEYLHPHLDAGTFAAPTWAIDLASILTGGAPLSQQPEARGVVDARLASKARELQRKYYGDGAGLHLEMIDWAREFDALTGERHG